MQTDFFIDKLNFKMYDVGGQRGERKKWIHSFDDVTAIMFIASLSEYDQKLAEDRTKNRLKESLDLFEVLIMTLFLRVVVVMVRIGVVFVCVCDLCDARGCLLDVPILFPLSYRCLM